MGKIHEALQRAEQERAAISAPSEGLPGVRDLVNRAGQVSSTLSRATEIRATRRARIVMNDPDCGVSEQYRSLRARIESIRRARPMRSIAITSALPREGKTTTAINLGLSFGLDLERETLLMDADMRTPGVHRVLPDPPLIGLAEVLEEDAKLEEALVRVPETRLSVLPVRGRPLHPSELLSSRRMTRLLEEVYGRFDTVLVDCPPVLGLPDATTLVDLCDATVFVVCRARAARSEIESALERVNAQKLLGTVFNRSPEEPTTYGYGGGR